MVDSMSKCYYQKCRKEISPKMSHMKLSIITDDKSLKDTFENYCNPNCVVDDLLMYGYGSEEVIASVFSDILTGKLEEAIANKVIPKDLKASK
jgi:hypothetical protein